MDRGAAAVEFAIIAPLFLLLVFGGIELGLTALEYGQIQRLSDQIADVSVDMADAQNIATQNGATVECWERSASPGCISDGFTGERTQVVVSSLREPLTGLWWEMTLRAESTGRITPP